MSWFNTSGFSNLAKSAISQAQKSIDKVLDIKEENVEDGKQQRRSEKLTVYTKSKSYSEIPSATKERKPGAQKQTREEAQKEQSLEEDSFFASFLGGSKQSTPKTNKIKSTDKGKSLNSSLADITQDGRLDENTKALHSKSSDSILESFKDKEINLNLKKIKNDELNLISAETKTLSVENKKSSNDNIEDIVANETKHDSDDLENMLGVSCEESEGVQDEESVTSNGGFSNGDFIHDCIDESEKQGKKDTTKSHLRKDDEVEKEDQDFDDESLQDVGLEMKTGKLDQIESQVTETTAKDTKNETSKLSGHYENAKDDILVMQHDFLNASNSEIDAAHMRIADQDAEIVVSGDSETNEDQSKKSIITENFPSQKKSKESTPEDVIDISSVVLDVSHSNIEIDEKSNEKLDSDDQSDISTADDLNGGAIKSVTGMECEIEDMKYEKFMQNKDSVVVRKEDSSDDSVEKGESSLRVHENSNLDCNESRKEKNERSKEVDYEKSVDEETQESVIEPEMEEYLQKEVRRLQEVVDARESKMVILSKENIDLQEAVSILRNQLKQAEAAGSGDDAMIMEMRDEFSKRIGEANTKLNRTIQERDDLQNQLEETTERLARELDETVNEFKAALEEKEDQISGLLVEGEALSKKELKSNTAVKRLRVKVKDLEGKVEKNEKEKDEKDKEITALKEKLKDKTEQEKTLQDQIKKLEMITDQQEDEISKLKDHLDDAEDKMKGMQTTLDSGYQEINRLSLEKANRESEIEEVTLLKNAKEELERKLIELENQSKLERQEEQNQLASLRLIITRTEQAAARREDSLQNEIKDLHERLEEAESRNQELSQSIASASRPLLRQIENLQSSHHNQALNWEKIEKNLSERLATAQHQVTLLSEKERSAVEFAMESKSRVSALELKIKQLRQEKEELSAKAHEKIETARNAEEDLSREKKKYEEFYKNYRKSFEEIQNEKVFIENTLNEERAKHEVEVLRITNEFKARRKLSRENSTSATNSFVSESKNDDEGEGDGPSSFARSRTSSTSSSSNIIDSNSRNASTAVMEKLQIQLRQKDGELKLLKEEIIALQKTRASLAQELVNLSNLIEELQEKMKDYDEMKQNHQAVESRYNAVLQMYGEKAEEADELRMDLEDIKQMYKQQIQQLIGDR